MPRRNNRIKMPKITPTDLSSGSKKTYATRAQAEAAIKTVQMYNPDIKLRAYRTATDTFWRLTSVDSDFSTD